MPPTRLFVQGEADCLHLLEDLPERGLAIVGTREPQARSIDQVHREIAELGQSDLIILSGLARGIDTAAHEAALRHDLPTIAVLGAGLDIDYPKQNNGLRERILEAGGLVISEFPPGVEPRPHHFLQRNRLIAAWSKAVWVVEASSRSGALNTARWSREQHRDCYATPCFPGDLALAGNQTLIDRDHAVPFWGAHSLGQTWVELAARPPRSPQTLHRPRVISLSRALPTEGQSRSQSQRMKVDQLLEFVASHQISQGGICLQECLEWAFSQNWKAEELFSAVRSAVFIGELEIHQGSLMISNISSKPLE